MENVVILVMTLLMHMLHLDGPLKACLTSNNVSKKAALLLANLTLNRRKDAIFMAAFK